MNKKAVRINKALKNGDLFEKIICWILIKTGFSNYYLQSMEIRNHNYIKLKKKYSKVLKNIDYPINNKKIAKNNNVWVCWFQGVENAPNLVKKCIKSIECNIEGGNVHIITIDNMCDYVDFPDYILEKWKKGIISNTHLSDLLRLELLINYGGLWVDATTLITDKIPDYVYEDFFLFRYQDRLDRPIKYNSWFIYSNKQNRILMATRDLLYEYWKKSNKLKEYFLLHLFLTMSIEKYYSDISKMFEITEADAHLLQCSLDKGFNSENYKRILSLSSVHKLTYKNIKEIPNSYYNYIMKEDYSSEK